MLVDSYKDNSMKGMSMYSLILTTRKRSFSGSWEEKKVNVKVIRKKSMSRSWEEKCQCQGHERKNVNVKAMRRKMLMSRSWEEKKSMSRSWEERKSMSTSWEGKCECQEKQEVNLSIWGTNVQLIAIFFFPMRNIMMTCRTSIWLADFMYVEIIVKWVQIAILSTISNLLCLLH